MPKKDTPQKVKKRSGERRKPLTEKEFRDLIETGKATEKDRRSWEERRRK
jgi:hypothetical protein